MGEMSKCRFILTEVLWYNVLFCSRAEVWSVCWSPGNERLATCSEDQTTKVWDTSDWKW